MVSGRVHHDELSARDADIISAIYELAKHGGEHFSTEFWEEWARLGGDQDKRRGRPPVVRMLRYLEELGELTSRAVLPAEHGQSQMARRYYRRAWGVEETKSGP